MIPILALLALGVQEPTCEVTTFVAQRLFGIDVAIQLELEPGWHIYWKNPGDSGEATSVKWDLPEGWQEAGLLFPTPHAIDAGGVINYGYESTVTLIARLIPPSAAKAGTVSLSGEVSYLICKEACVPGTRKFSVKIPADTVDEEKWVSFRKAMPQKLNSLVTSRFVGETLVISSSEPGVSKAYFFPESLTVIDHSAKQRFETTRGGFELTIPVSKYSTSRPKKVPGVLVLTKGDASACGYQVELTP